MTRYFSSKHLLILALASSATMAHAYTADQLWLGAYTAKSAAYATSIELVPIENDRAAIGDTYKLEVLTSINHASFKHVFNGLKGSDLVAGNEVDLTPLAANGADLPCEAKLLVLDDSRFELIKTGPCFGLYTYSTNHRKPLRIKLADSVEGSFERMHYHTGTFRSVWVTLPDTLVIEKIVAAPSGPYKWPEAIITINLSGVGAFRSDHFILDRSIQFQKPGTQILESVQSGGRKVSAILIGVQPDQFDLSFSDVAGHYTTYIP